MAQMQATMMCCDNSPLIAFQMDFNPKNVQGNVTDLPEGLILQVKEPGSTEFVDVGLAELPNEIVNWDRTGKLDGIYLFATVEVSWEFKCRTSAQKSCMVRGERSDAMAYELKKAKPGKAPPPRLLTTPCCK